MDHSSRRDLRNALFCSACSLLFVVFMNHGTLRAQSSPALVATVRGVVRQELHDGRLIPARSVRVSLSARIPSTSTGPNGLYYFQNVQPGAYTLTVDASSQPPAKYEVSIQARPYIDLPPIILGTTLLSVEIAYQNARRAITDEDWTGALFVFQQIVGQRAETARNRDYLVPVPGNNYEKYRPNFYLGLALLQLGDCKGAEIWHEEKQLGTPVPEHRRIMQQLEPKCSPELPPR